MGGLRFKTSLNGDFLDNNPYYASPPWTSLREIENASLNIEQDNADAKQGYINWLNLLMAPGSSLGGARPKAGVKDNEGQLWIAKFPSRNDENDSGAWEMITYELAVECGINMAECRTEVFSSGKHSFMTKRFDRNELGERIHFSSATTMLGYSDGADAATGTSYLEIAEFIIKNGAAPDEDLKQLWRRIVFNILVSNTDDHLRNHGFLLTSRGWRLSPAYDLNPDPDGFGLSLNITENDNRLDTELALETAPLFRIKHEEGKEVIASIKSVIKSWPQRADKYSIDSFEKDLMSHAFRV